MIYEYKYILKGEVFHWDNVKTDFVDLGPINFPLEMRNNKVRYEADRKEQELYVKEVKAKAKEDGTLHTLDPQEVLTEALKHGRLVLAVRQAKTMEKE